MKTITAGINLKILSSSEMDYLPKGNEDNNCPNYPHYSLLSSEMDYLPKGNEDTILIIVYYLLEISPKWTICRKAMKTQVV